MKSLNKLLRLKKNEDNMSSVYTNDTPTLYPSGIMVITESGHWYLKGNLKYLMPTERIVDSWGFTYAGSATDHALSLYKKGGSLGFRPGSLVKNVSDGKIYVVESSGLRHVQSPDWLQKLGGEPMLVSQKEINIHQEGEPLT